MRAKLPKSTIHVNFSTRFCIPQNALSQHEFPLPSYFQDYPHGCVWEDGSGDYMYLPTLSRGTGQRNWAEELGRGTGQRNWAEELGRGTGQRNWAEELGVSRLFMGMVAECRVESPTPSALGWTRLGIGLIG
jgi:hypothetical protein